MTLGGGRRSSRWFVSLLLLFLAPPTRDCEATAFRWASGAAWVRGPHRVLRPFAGVGHDAVVVAPSSMMEAWARATLTAGVDLRIAPGSMLEIRGTEVTLLAGSLSWESRRPVGGLWVGDERFVIHGCVLVELKDPFLVMVLDGHLHVNGRRFDRGMALRGSWDSAVEQRPFPRRWRRPHATPSRGQRAPMVASLPLTVADRRRVARERRDALFALEDLGDLAALRNLVSARLEPTLEARRRAALNEGFAAQRSGASAWHAYHMARAAEAATEDRRARKDNAFPRNGDPEFRTLRSSTSAELNLLEQLASLETADHAAAGGLLTALRNAPSGSERAYFIAYLLEIGGGDFAQEILPTMSVAETIMLQAVIAPLLFSDRRDLRAEAEKRFLRAGLFVALRDSELWAPHAVTGAAAPNAAHAREVLARPLVSSHADQLEAWATAGWTRFHLECLLGQQEPEFPTGVLVMAERVHGAPPLSWDALAEEVSAYQAVRVQVLHRLRGTVRDFLDSGAEIPEALTRYKPDWCLLRQILARLEEIPDEKALAWEPLLFSWLGSGPPRSLISEMGMAAALRLHLLTVLPMYQDPGEGLFPL